jgi:serine/threonine-protein kinase
MLASLRFDPVESPVTPTTSPELPVRLGETVAEKYRVERVLGVGGMGMVLAVTHVDLEEIRAIKVMLGGRDSHAVARFLREARAAVRLKSEHVARIHDVGRLENGAPYIVMEHLEGCDLRELVKQRGPLPIETAVLFVLQACDAIAEAHAAGIVHRDLKPANLFLTARQNGAPHVKVLDFGISKLPPSSPGAAELTGTADIMGSPIYMSPEQMRSLRDVDARADIWALGVILYELLTGRRPFEGETIPEVFAMVLERSPTPPSAWRPDLPPELEAIILRCLAKDRDRRTPTVAELVEELTPFAPSGASKNEWRAASAPAEASAQTQTLTMARWREQPATSMADVRTTTPLRRSINPAHDGSARAVIAKPIPAAISIGVLALFVTFTALALRLGSGEVSPGTALDVSSAFPAPAALPSPNAPVDPLPEPPSPVPSSSAAPSVADAVDRSLSKGSGRVSRAPAPAVDPKKPPAPAQSSPMRPKPPPVEASDGDPFGEDRK